MGITYDGTERLVMKAYCDANYVAREDRKSISKIVIIMAKSAVFWQSKKQSTVATSTIEAEYVACTNAVKELI